MQPCLFLVFPEGKRPTAAAVRAALAQGGAGQISYDPAASEAAVVSSDWLEVVLDGLTFDVLGLAPGRSLRPPDPRHCFGLSAAALAGCEAIGLAPGPHLAGAANAMPVVRTLLRLGCVLASGWDEALGTVWLPADSAMRRDVFLSAIQGWLTGGPFPALGLTGVSERAGGVLTSDGLAFFTGQEVALSVDLSTDKPAATRLVLRLIDRLVGQPPLKGEQLIELEDGRKLLLAGAGPAIHVSLI